MNKINIILSLLLIVACTSNRVKSYPSPELLLAESLNHAISLEILPDVSMLLNRDTIFVEVYDHIAGNDSVPDWFLSEKLPKHVDMWYIKPMFDKRFINTQDSNFYYLQINLSREEDLYTIDIICQPNGDWYIDRGAITLVYKFHDGVFVLIKLVRWYG